MFKKIIGTIGLVLGAAYGISWLTYFMNLPYDSAFAGGVLGLFLEVGIVVYLFEKIWFGGNHEETVKSA